MGATARLPLTRHYVIGRRPVKGFHTTLLVTFNITDFPPASVDRFAIDVLHPAEFLLDPLDLAPRLVINELKLQASSNRRRPKIFTDLLDALSRAGAEAFAQEVRQRSSTSNPVASSRLTKRAR